MHIVPETIQSKVITWNTSLADILGMFNAEKAFFWFVDVYESEMYGIMLHPGPWSLHTYMHT